MNNFSRYFTKMFENERVGINKDSNLLRFFKYLPNPDRKWYQIWKPKMIKNPNAFGDELVDIEIIKGATE